MKTKANVIAAKDPTAFLEQLAEGSAAPSALRDAIYPICAPPNADVQELKEIHRLEDGESI